MPLFDPLFTRGPKKPRRDNGISIFTGASTGPESLYRRQGAHTPPAQPMVDPHTGMPTRPAPHTHAAPLYKRLNGSHASAGRYSPCAGSFVSPCEAKTGAKRAPGPNEETRRPDFESAWHDADAAWYDVPEDSYSQHSLGGFSWQNETAPWRDVPRPPPSSPARPNRREAPPPPDTPTNAWF